MRRKITLSDVIDEVRHIRALNYSFKDDDAFVFWFLLTYLVDNEETAKSSLTGKKGGRGGDKNIDAVYIDHKNTQCNIIQGKFHKKEGYREKRNDVLAFTDIGLLPWSRQSDINTFYSQLDPSTKDKMKEVINYVKDKGYKLNLYYVTTGKCSDTIINEAKERIDETKPVDIYIISEKQILDIFEKCYLEGIAPANIPTFEIRIASQGTVGHAGIINIFDPRTNIESWIFPASGKDIGDMFAKAGDRLFAKNIRGFLGSTEINKAISETIKKEPHNFWYYNNGITIVCDDAKYQKQRGEDVIIIEGAQVINGQQTTRALYEEDSRNTNVLVKVIKIPKDFENDVDYDKYDKLVNSIVRATNWQNYISPSDLVSNDYIQIFLEREMRKIRYMYIRKKISKSEARRIFGQSYHPIKKTELAQAVGACLFDPAILRRGKERLFEDPYYKYIFGKKELSFYLSKYWLMRAVKHNAKGYSERAYAIWLVLNFLWKTIGNIIDSGSYGIKFRRISEQKNKDVLKPLYGAITDVFRASLKFYKLNKGKGEEAKDISTFFKLSGLDKKFEKFWKSSKNPYRSKFKQHITEFKEELEEFEIER